MFFCLQNLLFLRAVITMVVRYETSERQCINLIVPPWGETNLIEGETLI